MKKLRTGVWIVFLLACYQTQSFGQAFWRDKPRIKDIGYVAIDGSIGIGNYFGDLNPLAQYVSTDITATRPSFSIGLVRKYSPRLLVRAGFSWIRLTGNDFKAADPSDERHRYRYIRNAHFRNTLYELSIVGMYDLRPSRFVYYKRVNYTPYLLFGVAGFYHNPRAKTPDGKWTNLRPLRTEGQGLKRSSGPDAGKSYGKMYSPVQVAIPLGVGVRFKLNDRTDLSVDVAYRLLFTDYIDDVSRNYANPIDLAAHNPLSPIMADRTLEPKDARTGGSRVNTLTELKNTLGYDPDPLAPFAGFGNDGDKRGESNNVDIYIVTGVHLSYILNVGLKCPKFR
jgi:Domain of unknown function (DUF6089)